MDEPSVLDYVKAKLAFWKASSIKIPSTDEVDALSNKPVTGELRPVQPVAQAQEIPEKRKRVSKGYMPSAVPLLLAPLALVLIAQGFLEPPGRAWKLSMFIYAVAAALIAVAYFRNLLLAGNNSEEVQDPPVFTFRFSGVLVGTVLMVLTFLFFGSKPPEVPKFNFINTALWILSVGYLVWAFWFPSQDTESKSWGEKLVKTLSASSWKINLSRWGVLLLLVTGLVLFYRFYRLDNVPAEMFSDHAEKLLDVSDVLKGQLNVFFPRNTGREAFQFYLTALVVKLFNTGISFMALKLGTAICGILTLVYIYRLGNEIGNRWVALFALLFTGFSYWANIQSRIGLRFPLYPFFLAPTLFYLIRGLRQMNRNDFIFAGLWLGVSLHGYTANRIVPFVIVAGILIYLLHHRTHGQRQHALWGLLVITLVSLAIFMPLLRLTLDQPDLIAYRSLTRLGDLERPLPGPVWQIFLKNSWNALVMFFWDDGEVWVHSIPHRPAMDVISAGIFFIGLILLLFRYLRKRSWVDLFLLVMIPLLLLPSILSLAFPNENPNLNRTAGAYVPAFLILAVGLESLLSSVKRSLPSQLGTVISGSIGILLVLFSALNNYDLVFSQYADAFRNNAWNTSEMGEVIRDFTNSMGNEENAWVVAYPYWVDTRLVGINAGYPTRDTAIDPAHLDDTLQYAGAKMFLINTQDGSSLAHLQELYPEGRYWIYPSRVPTKEFVIFQVLPQGNLFPHQLPLDP